MGSLIKIPGGPDGPGSFIGFYYEDDGTLRHLQGWEWQAYVAGGNEPHTYSQGDLATILGTAKVSGNPPPGYLDATAQAAWDRQAGLSNGGSAAPAAPAAAPAAAAVPAAVAAPPNNPTVAAPVKPPVDVNAFRNQVNADFPWLAQLGLDTKWFQETAAESPGAASLLAKIRGSSQYKQRFAGLYREDGSLRMNEAQYLARESDFRGLLRQFGYNMDEYKDPASLVGLFASEMDPNEFQKRLQTYQGVKESSQAKKDAFYVYAGMELSDDDLYTALVDPAHAQHLSNEYNSRIAGGSLDYGTWITRATEVGNRRVADTLTKLSANGQMTGAAIQAVISVDPQFARQMMDAIYTGGSGNPMVSTMSLEDLLNSFEYAAVGAAAKEGGLVMPTKARLAEIRQAGIEMSAAQKAYTAYGSQQNQISAYVQRAGYDQFTQDEFERSAFLGDADLQKQLQEGQAREAAAGHDEGSFRFGEDQGRLVQRGLSRRY